MPEQQQTPPIALGLIIADAMFRDLGSGKISIQGIYNAIGAPRFPWTHPSMMVYGAITDGRPGKTPLMLRLVDVDEAREPVFEAATEVDLPDPHTIAEFVLPLIGLTFPEPGDYRLQLIGANDSVLIERRILVVPLQQNPETPEPHEGD